MRKIQRFVIQAVGKTLVIHFASAFKKNKCHLNSMLNPMLNEYGNLWILLTEMRNKN
jgi:hypothetical protein